MIAYHTMTGQTAYHELLSALQDEAVSEIRGSAKLRTHDKRQYWYDRYRIGGQMKERFLGEDSAELRQRLERHRDLKQQQPGRDQERTRLVRLLRGERYLGADTGTGSLLRALSRAGLFRLGGVLVGTYAFRQYQGELGLRLPIDQLAQTQDIDLASFERLSLVLDEKVAPELATIFRDFDFEPILGLSNGSVWRWQQTAKPMKVEFLTPSFTEAEEVRSLPALGVAAQSLHHLNYLIAEPLPAALIYRQGVLIQIPRPERFAIHKLIVSERRKDGPDSAKARKDRMQAELLIEALSQDRPGDLHEAYEDALSRGPRWRERIEGALRRAPKSAERLATLDLR